MSLLPFPLKRRPWERGCRKIYLTECSMRSMSFSSFNQSYHCFNLAWPQPLASSSLNSQLLNRIAVVLHEYWSNTMQYIVRYELRFLASPVSTCNNKQSDYERSSSSTACNNESCFFLFLLFLFLVLVIWCRFSCTVGKNTAA